MEASKETKIERIKQLTNDKGHIRQRALYLAGNHLQYAREEIIERETDELEETEEESEIYEACSNQLEVISDEIVSLDMELVAQSKETLSQSLDTYLLSDTQTSTHRVTIDQDHVTLQQRATFNIGLDDQIMLVAILKAIKADKNTPHSFSNVNATYNFFYEPAGASNSFVVRHTVTGRTIGMDPRTARNLLNALTGETKHLTRIGKGGPLLAQSTRRKRLVKIAEVNTPPSSLFDTSVAYPSDALPEWFKTLQSIVEDETFTSMDITLGSVTYHISLVADDVQSV